ncbi:MAG: hypothetical protein WBR29_10795 [Gammaproteobacteria bacterium]
MRNQDWLKQLTTLVQERRQQPHAWGSNDCCLFAADAVLAVTGEDKAAPLRGTYSDQAQAEKIIRDYGGLEALLTHFLGESLGPICARRGDLVLFTAPNGLDCVGVCMGTNLVCPGDERLNTFSMESAKKSWRVG